MIAGESVLTSTETSRFGWLYIAFKAAWRSSEGAQGAAWLRDCKASSAAWTAFSASCRSATVAAASYLCRAWPEPVVDELDPAVAVALDRRVGRLRAGPAPSR